MNHNSTEEVNQAEMAKRSDRLVSTALRHRSEDVRDHYLQHRNTLPGPWIAKSHFVPSNMVEHLMRRKKDAALAVKFIADASPPNEITHLEGALHTFVTPVVSAVIHGDYIYRYGHELQEFEHGQGRHVLVSAMIQQDFEFDNVMLHVAELRREATIGSSECPAMISVEEKQDRNRKTAYDDAIRRFLVYHLTQERRLPAVPSELRNVPDVASTIGFLIAQIRQNTGPNHLLGAIAGYYFTQRNRYVSLEVMFRTAIHQIRNEMMLLEHICAGESHSGYVYTFNPPVIFARWFYPHGVLLLSLIHVAALQYVAATMSFARCRIYAWDNFDAPGILSLITTALEKQPHILVMPKSHLFRDKGYYSPPQQGEEAMLVIHNNSDAFGQNIETEGEGGSLDGVIGTYSSAAASLMRDRADLCEKVLSIPDMEML